MNELNLLGLLTELSKLWFVGSGFPLRPLLRTQPSNPRKDSRLDDLGQNLVSPIHHSGNPKRRTTPVHLRTITRMHSAITHTFIPTPTSTTSRHPPQEAPARTKLPPTFFLSCRVGLPQRFKTPHGLWSEHRRCCPRDCALLVAQLRFLFPPVF
ncbi:hypothetical protein K402DRAFT_390247 [Aulographum hederae CBS 113979]|uniref:Uncharacterized protein n=1 Tax=Aulographum hederae CBS 113979 TaxID=1176131 RepID=A0A6G1H9S5_9PEZI|nr:hypothetical protein K402DRAFT_390247 [Aulographum hederae CBS 113979]